jgi:DNA-nicking Smr family endonuclease
MLYLLLSIITLSESWSLHQTRNGEIAMDPVVVPIDGLLDLHTFVPGEINGLMDEYINACLEAHIFDLRIIHGKGKGIMRSRVKSLLERDPRVGTISDAPAEDGGWGATLVTLKRTRYG